MRLVRHQHNIWFLGRDHHLGVFRPSAPGGNYSSWGFHYRHRLAEREWFHLHLKLHMKPRAKTRREHPGCRGWRMYEL
ncbi:MAG TPA: hypothetical protein VLC07_03220, partial [Solirubrobacterales bacterium]|nr:hypothetical protein [Solirubrobacterales bacterium]